MNNRLILLNIILIIPFALNAQKINISLPQNANKEYAFILNKGTKQDTIQSGKLAFTGGITVKIPQKDKDYVGMGSLQIENVAPINIIINNEDFSVEQGSDQKYMFKGSKENTYLYSIIQDGVSPAPDSTLYASHFIDLIRLMQRLNKTSQGATLREVADVRLYVLDQLDLERLYTSSIWYYVIDGVTKLTSNQEMMGNDMVRLLKRIKSQEVFEHFANNLITITEQFGWDDAFDIIVPYIKESGRIEFPQGNMFKAFALAKIQKGNIPPPLEGLKAPLESSNAQNTLLVFYQPDCENCHLQMEILIRDYPELKKKGVRIISISSDINKETNEQYAKRLPWPDDDKLCDFKSFAGNNFINYGIMSAPTFFLLDENKKVIKRYALISDIDSFQKKQ